MEAYGGDDNERVNYMNKLKREEQGNIINVRSCSSSTVCSVTWTHRTTGCDVISTVTTTLPIKNGNMKDIKMYNSEMRKIKAPGKKPGLNLYVSPLEDDATGGNSRSRKHFNDILRAERTAFMNRLHKARHQRSATENISAIAIQRIFRGYWVRWHMDQIIKRKAEQTRIRQTIRALAAEKGLEFPVLSEHRLQYSTLRNHAATVIQCAFRCYVSRILIRRLEREMFHIRRRRAVVLIQCMARCKSAVDRVAMLRERKLMYRRFRAAVMVQSVYRGILCKRRVRKRMWKMRWLAARMIQCAFRGRNTRKSFAIFLAAAERIKLFRAARGVQKVVRGCISRARVQRIKLRKIYKTVFSAATRIQTLVRLVLCNKRVLNLLIDRQKKQEEADEAEKARQEQEEDKQAQELADSIDIFVQTKAGNIGNVDSLYHHEKEAGDDVLHNINEDGDTILSIAARYGHLDIARKCLQWGFDVNHENSSGESVIALAAENGHLEVATYIMTAPSSASTKEGDDTDGTFLTSTGQVEYSDHDAGLLLSAAAKCDDIKYMRTILEVNASSVNAVHPVTEATALHVACEKGNMEMVQLLIKSGARVDPVDDMGHSVLQKACCSDNVNVVKLLLGLDSDYCNESFPATDESRSELLLKKDSDGKDCLLMAALRGRRAVVSFINDQANMSARTISDEIGWSAEDIESAISLASNGDVASLKVLLEANFDLSWAPEETGTTLAMAACKAGKTEMLDFLMGKKADFSTADEQKRNALHYAAECSTESVIPYLLSAGSAKTGDANISPSLLSEQDSNGCTVLHVIAEHNSTLSFELVALEFLGIALSKHDSSGKTPLHIACSKGNSEMVLELIRLGSDVTAIDKNGKNAIWHYCFQTSDAVDIELPTKFDPEIVKSLVKAGCPLFSCPYRSIESAVELFRNYTEDSGSVVREKTVLSMEGADLLAVGGKLTILTVLADMLDAEDCWRLVLSCVFFSATNKPLASVFDGKGVETLRSWDPEIKGRGIKSLEHVLFMDLTIFGWALKAENVPIITYLLRMGIHPDIVVDKFGNNALHFSAMLGSMKIVDTVLNAHDEVLLLEKENDDGQTAAMLSAKAGNIAITRKLLRSGCNARKALSGKYWGWLLALVRTKERNQIDTQTGIYGDDDEKYFSLYPDPTYVMWE